MAKPMLIFATVVAKARSYWKCDGCGVLQQGETIRVQSESLDHTPSQMGDAMVDLTRYVSNQRMPAGWSSHANDRHLCPECKE